MAQASGLPLLTVGQRDPLRTTTLGTGQLLDAAARLGPAKILLGLGGSATVDGGTGAARALGWCFLDRHGRALPWGGGALARLSRIVRPTPPLALPPVEALCDVRNPLCGPQGAAAVFGPQKGATPEMVVRLDEGLANLAECIRRDLGMDVSHLPGSGAAGGFGAGAVAFLGARIVPGIDTIAAVAGLPEALRAADWVVTGEGCLDSQSLQGKVVSGVLGLALSARVRVAVLAGRVRLTPGQWRAAGIQSAVAAAPTSVSEAEAMAHATELLAGAAGRLVPELES
jgi:glycerate kinase